MLGWLDASAGASGDMLLGALVDAGVPVEVLVSTVDSVVPGRVELTAAPDQRHGLAGTRVTVRAQDAAHRTLPDILARLAGLPEPVREPAARTFELLAHAEAAVHRIAPERVHFHEVGALDAIADIVGAAAGVDWLRRERGLRGLTVGPIEAGSGAPPVRAGHGAVPVPAPAVLEVARRAGLVLTGRLAHEACTPTGAALLATLTDGQGSLPALRPEAIGTGVGGRDPEAAANVLRLVLGSVPGHAEPAVLLECNVDDLDPRLWPAALAALLGAGAVDAWLSPILMKKGRPAHTLHALCPQGTVAAVRTAMYANTTTIGVREQPVTKHPLDREMSTVDVAGQLIGVKLARLDGAVVNASVEYDDAARAAAVLGRPVRSVLAEAAAAAQRWLDADQEGQ